MWNRGDISGTDWISDGVKYIEHLTVQQTIQFQEKSEKWKDPFGNICRLLDNVWRLRQHSEIFINSNYGNPFPKLVPAVALQSVTRHDLNILEFSFTTNCIILLTAKRWMLNDQQRWEWKSFFQTGSMAPVSKRQVQLAQSNTPSLVFNANSSTTLMSWKLKESSNIVYDALQDWG